MSAEAQPTTLQCELVDAEVDEHDDQGYLFRRLGEICFHTTKQAEPSQPGSQRCVVAAGTLGLTAFSDEQGKYSIARVFCCSSLHTYEDSPTQCASGLYIAATSSLIQASSKGKEGT